MTWIRLAAARLENDEVLLQPLREEHRSLLHPIAMDRRIWTHFTTVIETDEDFHHWFSAALAAQEAGGRVVFHITDKRSGATAGSMSYCGLAEADRRLEIGASWLGTAFQGRGVNRWAKYLLMRHAFEELGAERVEFKTDILNIQARRALSNIGAKEEGVLRSYNFMPGGRRRDAVFFSVLRAEWPKVSQGLLTGEKILLPAASSHQMRSPAR